MTSQELASSFWLLALVTCHSSPSLSYRRGGAPGPFFFTFGLRDPRGSVCLGLGGRFLRAWRFNLLRSARSLMFRVFMCRGSVRLDLRLFKRGVAFDQLLLSIARKADGYFRVLAFALAIENSSQAVLGVANLHPELP